MITSIMLIVGLSSILSGVILLGIDFIRGKDEVSKSIIDACVNYIKKINSREILFKDGSVCKIDFNIKECYCSE